MIPLGLVYHPVSAVIQLALAASIAFSATERRVLARLVALVLVINAVESLLFAIQGRTESRLIIDLTESLDVLIVWALPLVVVLMVRPVPGRWWIAWWVIVATGMLLAPFPGSIARQVYTIHHAAADTVFAAVMLFVFVPYWAKGLRSPERAQALLMACALSLAVGVRATSIGWNGVLAREEVGVPYLAAAALLVAASYRALVSGSAQRRILFGVLVGSVVVGLTRGLWNGFLLYEFLPQSARPALIAGAILLYDLFALDVRPRRVLARVSITLVAWSTFVFLASFFGRTTIDEPADPTGLVIAGAAVAAAMPFLLPMGHRLLHPETTGDERRAGPGDVIVGRYGVERRLAEGGQGNALVANGVETGERVLLKEVVCHFRPGAREERWALDNEARFATAAAGPGLPRIIETFTWRGNYYLAREFIEGPTLAEFARDGLSQAQAIGIVRDLLEPAGRLHDQGVAHGDLKPENIIMRDGRPVIIDLGIARSRHSAAGVTADALDVHRRFTPAWAAPEQRDGTGTGPQTDIFQVGLLLSRLTGAQPHDGTRLGGIIAQATDEAVAARFPSASAFLHALEGVDGESVSHGGDLSPYDRTQ